MAAPNAPAVVRMKFCRPATLATRLGATLVVAGDIPGDTRTASLAVYDAIQAHREAEATGYVLVLSAIALFAMYAVTKLTDAGARR